MEVNCYENAEYNTVEFSPRLTWFREVLQGAPLRSKHRRQGTMYVLRRESRSEKKFDPPFATSLDARDAMGEKGVVKVFKKDTRR